MKLCPNCGQQSPDDTVFCPSCGQRVPDQPPPAKSGGFCPNCGAPQPAGAGFCANCGFSLAAPAQPQAQSQAKPAKKGGGAKKAVIAVAAVVLAAAIGVGGWLVYAHFFGGGVGLFASEEEQFVGYQKAVLADPMMDAVERMLRVYSGEISTDLTITASVEGNSQLQNFLKDTAVRLSLEAGGGSLLANTELVLMGSPVISGLVTYDSGVAGFCLPELDKSYYTADLSRMLKNPAGQSIDFDRLLSPDIPVEDCRRLLQEYMDVVSAAVTQDNLETEKNQSFRLSRLRESYTGTVYTFTPTARDTEKLLLDLAERLEKDKQLRQVLLELFESELSTALIAMQGGREIDLEEAIDDMLSHLAEELEDCAEDAADWVEDTNLTWTLYMEGREVRMITIAVDVGRGNTWSVVYERAGSESKGLTQAFYMMIEADDSEEEGVFFLLESSRVPKGDTLTGEVKLLRFPDTMLESGMTLEYEMDTGSVSPLGIPCGTYELEMPIYAWRNDSEQLKISASLSVSEAGKGSYDHVFSIDGDSLMIMADSSLGLKRIDITINATDRCTAKVPADKEVDITSYDEDELEDLFESLDYEAQRLMGGVLSDLQRVIGLSGGGSASGAA